MSILDTHLSEAGQSTLKKYRGKVGMAFFTLFVFLIVVSFLFQNYLNNLADKKEVALSDITYLQNQLLLVFVIVLFFLGWILGRLIIPTYETYLDLMTDILSLKKGPKEVSVSDKENQLVAYRSLNIAVDNAVLFASLEKNGTVAYMSDKFAEFLGYSSFDRTQLFTDVLTTDEDTQTEIKELLENAQNKTWQGELLLPLLNGDKKWLEVSIIPVNYNDGFQRLLWVATDISQNKESQFEIQRLTTEHYEEEIRLQQEVSQQIVTAQEDERKRIAKDIHDGIGQMLTALRFSIDGINLDEKEIAQESLQTIKEVFGQLILDVRAVTFSLTPPELGDHGLGAAIRKMTQELSRLTQHKILFDNQSDDLPRLDSSFEINIYRVVQEAINNALKYAESSYILVSMFLEDDQLVISVEDDGKGFDVAAMHQSKEGLGLGLRFMQERMKFVNGIAGMTSKLGEGSKITFEIPLESDL